MDSEILDALREPPSPRERRDRAEQKFGLEVVLAGYQIVPDVLVRYQGRLGLAPIDMCVLLNLGAHWWYADNQPSPRSRTIAHRINTHVRNVQRSLRSLRNAGLVEMQRVGGRRQYDLKPLAKRLESLARRDLAMREK
jgi:hypothetical protein